jgi:hypothetical protein
MRVHDTPTKGELEEFTTLVRFTCRLGRGYAAIVPRDDKRGDGASGRASRVEPERSRARRQQLTEDAVNNVRSKTLARAGIRKALEVEDLGLVLGYGWRTSLVPNARCAGDNEIEMKILCNMKDTEAFT